VLALGAIAAITSHKNDVLRTTNDRLRNARDQADANRSKAETERLRAEENLSVARKLTRELLVAAEEELPKLEGRGKLRRDTLQASLQLMQDLSGEQPHDQALRRDLALLRQVYANVIRYVDREGAIKEMELAIRQLEELSEEAPEDRTTRDRLAGTLRDYGNLLKRGARYSEAAQMLGRSLEIASAMHEDDPESLDYRRTQATVQMDLGSLQIELAQLADALPNLSAAAGTFRELADGPTPGRLDANLLLLALNGQSEVLIQLERADEAQTVLENGIQRARRLVESSLNRPIVPDKNMQHALARLLMLSSHLPSPETRAREETMAQLTEATAIWEELVTRWKDSSLRPIYQSYLGQALNRQGEVWLAEENLDNADTNFQRAVEILEPLATQLPDTSAHLASALANRGRLALRRGDTSRATELLRQAVALQAKVLSDAPESGTAQQQLERLRAELAALDRP
jgi:tetratricopeptide (TPR) repeat protein